MVALAAVVHALGDTAAVEEAVDALEYVAGWWP